MPEKATPVFADLTRETAPAPARPLLDAVRRQLGFVPAAVARMAASPRALETFLKASAVFETSTLDPLARETVVLTVAARNACGVCIALHTRKLHALGADEELVQLLREELPLPDGRLEAVRAFTVNLLDRAGEADPEVLDAFLGYGYTSEQALEVVLGVGVYTLSTLANRLTAAPVDAALHCDFRPVTSAPSGPPK